MSNTRKLKNNATKNELPKPEPTKTAPAKAAVFKSAPAPAKPLAVQLAPVISAQTAVTSAKAAPVRSTTAPQAAAGAAASEAVSATPKEQKVGHVSLELVKPGAKRVCVAGSFNEWKPEKTPLVQIGSGRWVGDLAVKPGKHEYLFVVDGQWLPDPNAKESVQNPFGGRNSILMVSA